MKENIRSYNTKGKLHGYQEWYWDNELYFRGHMKHEQCVGYHEFINIRETIYYIK